MSAENAVALAPQPQGQSLIARMAQRFGVEPNRMLATLKATAFRGEVSNEQMMALLIVAEQFKLNPWTKEIYAFPDKNNGIVPVVGVDGWARILNEQPQFDGVEFTDGPLTKDGLPEWIECKIYRKDRQHATIAREYMSECKRGTGPWGSHPRRMLRHKSLIQCARLAMGFVGIYDQDEAERIVEGTATLTQVAPAVADLNAEINGAATRVIEAEPPATAGPAPELPLDSPAPTRARRTPEPKPVDGPTYAVVRAAIEKAENYDALDLAADLIAAQPAQFHAELKDLVAARRMELAKS